MQTGEINYAVGNIGVNFLTMSISTIRNLSPNLYDF